LENIIDNFFTIGKSSQIEIRIKGSRFIGMAMPCSTESDADKLLAEIRKIYYSATHHCFAYRIGLDWAQAFRYSDAGEPSGTAGKPIYDQILGKNLTNLIIVVTRYFGGTKLGTGGLTHAYSNAADMAITSAEIIERFIMEDLLVAVQYTDYNIIERMIHKYGGDIIERGMENQIPSIKMQLRKSSIGKFKEEAIEKTSGRVRFGEDS
jgi:uncharacterized YigZ family protein